MENTKKIEVIAAYDKLDALISAADALADYVKPTDDVKDKCNQFMNLFYMAVDVNEELKALLRAL